LCANEAQRGESGGGDSTETWWAEDDRGRAVVGRVEKSPGPEKKGVACIHTHKYIYIAYTYGRGEVVGVKRYKKINKCCKKTRVFFPGDDGRGKGGRE